MEVTKYEKMTLPTLMKNHDIDGINRYFQEKMPNLSEFSGLDQIAHLSDPVTHSFCE